MESYMLSQQTIDLVKSTVPILQEQGETLTKYFYKRMFSQNPEVAPYFNSANQTEGAQQRALAEAICTYAANIDNLNALKETLEQIAHKHASLMIKPQHYPIVGANLLASIREVLGEDATDDVIHAWSHAYDFLANILTGREKQIYNSNAKKTGGWEGFRRFNVEKKEAESSVITSFYLKPADGNPLPKYLPGQYITVRIPTPDGSTTMRNYSLSDKPGQDHFRISVKREIGIRSNTPKGYVSHKLHDEINVGDVLEIGPPCGEFFLDAENHGEHPLVLLAAGVGITPILSILKTAVETMPKREIVFIYGCLNEKVQAFKSTIDQLAKDHSKLKIHYRYSDPEAEGVKREGNCSTGFVDAELIDSLMPDRYAEYYFCGPEFFMINIYQNLMAWDIPNSLLHFEFFGPRQQLEQMATV